MQAKIANDRVMECVKVRVHNFICHEYFPWDKKNRRERKAGRIILLDEKTRCIRAGRGHRN